MASGGSYDVLDLANRKEVLIIVDILVTSIKSKWMKKKW